MEDGHLYVIARLPYGGQTYGGRAFVRYSSSSIILVDKHMEDGHLYVIARPSYGGQTYGGRAFVRYSSSSMTNIWRTGICTL